MPDENTPEDAAPSQVPEDSGWGTPEGDGWHDVSDDGRQGAPSLAEDKPSGQATAALIVGILSIVFLFAVCCCSLFSNMLGAALGVGALVIGIMERKAIREGRSSQAGSGMAMAGLILGAIGLVLNLAVLAFFVVALFVSESGSMPSDSQPVQERSVDDEP